MKSIVNIVLLLLPLTLLAQKADSLKRKKDFLPTGFRIGTDVISLIRTPTDDSFDGYKINADSDFYRFYLAVEAGRWERNLSTEEELYDNSGNYGRIGVDVNFLLKDPDKNLLFFGARYGRSTYSENFTQFISDPVWNDDAVSYQNSDVTASWAELTTGLRVKMWKMFWMGYTARFKFGLSTNEPRGFVSYDVPGYGKTGKDTTWGFNYQVLFRIPIRKQQ